MCIKVDGGLDVFVVCVRQTSRICKVIPHSGHWIHSMNPKRLQILGSLEALILTVV